MKCLTVAKKHDAQLAQCETVYKIVGRKDLLKEIEGKIQYMFDTARDERKVGKVGCLDPEADRMWEGNLILLLGGDPYCFPMRGFITGWELYEDYLEIYADEAWYLTDFRFSIESILDVRVFFMAEGSGLEVFMTNDKEGEFFSNRFIFIHSDGETDYPDNEEDLKEYEESDPRGRVLRVEII